VFTPYQSWRKSSYEEAIVYEQLRAQARARTIGGTVAMVGGAAAMYESQDRATDLGGLISVIGGAVTLKSAIVKRQESVMHAEALEELGTAAEGALIPHTIDLENQVVRLHGTVTEQYDELRGILRQLYFEDLDLELPSPPAAEPQPADET
jgi:hypothetical protein